MTCRKQEPKSEQRKKIMTLFDHAVVITKFDAAIATNRSPVSAALLLNSLVSDGRLSRGPDREGVTRGNPLRTFVLARESRNPAVTSKWRRYSNKAVTGEWSNAWAR